MEVGAAQLEQPLDLPLAADDLNLPVRLTGEPISGDQHPESRAVHERKRAQVEHEVVEAGLLELA